MLDLKPLESAVKQLKRALDDHARYPEVETVRDGVIQCFEFTYDLAQKMVRRYLMETEASAEEFEDMPLADIVRRASDRGLTLRGWDQWSMYRKSRNITSHTYDRAKALEVFSIIPAFYDDVATLLQRMIREINA